MSLTKVTYSMLAGNLYDVPVAGTELSTILTGIGSTKTELVINKNVVVTANTIIPTTLNVSVLKGATISISDGVVLNFSGQLQAGLYQVFDYTGSGTGQVNLGPSVPMVFPEWFVPDVTGTPNLSLQYAYNAAQYQGSQIYISQSIWMSATLLCHTSSKEITIRGASTRVLLRYDGAGGVISLQNGNNCLLENFGIDTQVVPADQLGITVNGCYRVSINKVTMATRGLTLKSTGLFAPFDYGGVYWSNFNTIKAAWIWLNSAYNTIAINQNTFINCQTIGFNPTTNAALALQCSNGSTYGCLSNTFIGCDFSYANGVSFPVWAIYIDQYARDNTFIDQYIEPVAGASTLGAILNYGENTSMIGGYISGALAVYPANSENYAIYTVEGGTKLSELRAYDINFIARNAAATSTLIPIASGHITGQAAFLSLLNDQSVGFAGYGYINGIYLVTNLTDGTTAMFVTGLAGACTILSSTGANWSTTYNDAGKEGLGYIAANNGPYLFSKRGSAKNYRVFCMGGY